MAASRPREPTTSSPARRDRSVSSSTGERSTRCAATRTPGRLRALAHHADVVFGLPAVHDLERRSGRLGLVETEVQGRHGGPRAVEPDRDSARARTGRISTHDGDRTRRVSCDPGRDPLDGEARHGATGTAAEHHEPRSARLGEQNTSGASRNELVRKRDGVIEVLAQRHGRRQRTGRRRGLVRRDDPQRCGTQPCFAGGPPDGGPACVRAVHADHDRSSVARCHAHSQHGTSRSPQRRTARATGTIVQTATRPRSTPAGRGRHGPVAVAAWVREPRGTADHEGDRLARADAACGGPGFVAETSLMVIPMPPSPRHLPP